MMPYVNLILAIKYALKKIKIDDYYNGSEREGIIGHICEGKRWKNILNEEATKKFIKEDPINNVVIGLKLFLDGFTQKKTGPISKRNLEGMSFELVNTSLEIQRGWRYKYIIALCQPEFFFEDVI
jgi:hypothetical protein